MSDPDQEHYSATQLGGDEARGSMNVDIEITGRKPRLKSVKHVARSV